MRIYANRRFALPVMHWLFLLVALGGLGFLGYGLAADHPGAMAVGPLLAGIGGLAAAGIAYYRRIYVTSIAVEPGAIVVETRGLLGARRHVARAGAAGDAKRSTNLRTAAMVNALGMAAGIHMQSYDTMHCRLQLDGIKRKFLVDLTADRDAGPKIQEAIAAMSR